MILQTSTQPLSPGTAVMYQHSPSETTDYHQSQNDNKSQVQQHTSQISAEPIQLRFVVVDFKSDGNSTWIIHELFRICRQTHHQHSSHAAASHHSSGGNQSGHIDAKYTDNVNGHDTLTDFVTFVCQETDSSPQSSQVNSITFNKRQNYF